MDGIEPVMPAESGINYEAISDDLSKVSDLGEAQRAHEAAIDKPSVTNEIAVTDRAPQLIKTAFMSNVTYSLYSNIPGHNPVETSDVAEFSETAERLEQLEETELIPVEQEMDERALHTTHIVNIHNERLFEPDSNAREGLFQIDVQDVHIVQPVEDRTDARRDSGYKYLLPDETKDDAENEQEKKERQKLEQRNLIIDEAESWKGHENKNPHSAESRSQASQDQIASYLPFAGLYPFSKS